MLHTMQMVLELCMVMEMMTQLKVLQSIWSRAVIQSTHLHLVVELQTKVGMTIVVKIGIYWYFSIIYDHCNGFWYVICIALSVKATESIFPAEMEVLRS